MRMGSSRWPSVVSVAVAADADAAAALVVGRFVLYTIGMVWRRDWIESSVVGFFFFFAPPLLRWDFRDRSSRHLAARERGERAAFNSLSYSIGESPYHSRESQDCSVQAEELL